MADTQETLPELVEITDDLQTTLVFYDSIPSRLLPSLHRQLKEGRVIVEFDYDRVGWSRTGFIYRVRPRVRHG